MILTHVSLFSGIGGFDLAAEWAGFRTVLMCERDPYCRRVLERHWPHVPIAPDIWTLTADVVRSHGIERVDLLTGGFPCQPFSVAGKRGGEGDDRFIWPQMRRVIAEVRPRFVCGENVDDFIGFSLDQLCADLEAEGYAVGPPVVLPALAVGAAHRRDRVFIVAHTDCHGFPQAPPAAGLCEQADPYGDAGHTDAATRANLVHAFPDRRTLVAQPDLVGTDHGIPRRVDRLRALGNAVVPQVVYPILAAIADTFGVLPLGA